MSSERDNRLQWDRGPGHYEVWYTTLSHPATRTGFWLRYTVHSPTTGRGEPYAMLWFARTSVDAPDETFAFHRRFPITAFATRDEPFAVQIGDAEQRHDGSRGALAGLGHDVRWDLTWTPSAQTYYHLPALFYRVGDTKVLSPNLSAPTRGEIVVDGRTYTFDGEPAGQSHIWGRKHAYQWAWSHCVAWDGGRAAAFESISARLKRGAIILPRLTVFSLILDGEEIAFREAWKIPLARADWRTGRYHLIGAGPTARVEAEFTCRAEDTILAEYVDPDGDPAFCHNTTVADLTVQVHRRSPFVGRFREAERLTATRTAHWEWAARAGDAAQVKRWHQRLPDA